MTSSAQLLVVSPCRPVVPMTSNWSEAASAVSLHLSPLSLPNSVKPIQPCLDSHKHNNISFMVKHSTMSMRLDEHSYEYRHMWNVQNLAQNSVRLCIHWICIRKPVPERCCRALSVMRPFWERLREVREVRSFMFFTPTSVIPPPHSSNVCSFLKSAFQLTKQNMVSLLGLQYRKLLGTQNRKLLTSAQAEVGLEKDEERPPEKLDTKTNKDAFLWALAQWEAYTKQVGSRIKTSKMKGEDESQWNFVNVNLQQDNSTKKSGKWRRPTSEAWCAIVCDPCPKEIQGLQTSQT